MTIHQQTSLTPILIEKGTKPYLSVEKLRHCLQDDDIRNVALTGPFGSGKSSVVRTLMEEDGGEHSFLDISLATLDIKKKKIGPTTRVENDDLNKKIEFSILQQLVYREKGSTLRNSRFRRIPHFEGDEVTQIVLVTLLAVLAIAIAFEPTFLKIDTLCKLFNFGDINVCFDFLAMGYLFWFGWVVLHWLVEKYWGSKFSKLNIINGEIEVKESGSIFNEHLEEIVYFFQATKYDVVIIEDLDRFESPDIFLKLRELNYLLNKSKVTGNRKIVFVYCVKDDLFSDASRTKFFDYIIPVIPVMNPSNAGDLLKGKLEALGYHDIDDDSMMDIASFINDMRLLLNIVNEYQQYREQLMGAGTHLSAAKLLAIIVYKNYYPDQFSLMHQEKGRICNCFDKKPEFIKYAKEQKIAQRKDKITKDYQDKQDSSHLKLKELRTLYVFAYWEKIQDVQFRWLIIDGISYTPAQVADNDDLFNKLISQSTVTYKRHNSQYNYTQEIPFKDIETQLSSTSYKQRKKVILDEVGDIDSTLLSIQREEETVNNYTLQQLMMQIQIEHTEDFKALGLTPMEHLFLFRGYISEDYYDYISYFYSGFISENDRKLMLEIKLNQKPAYDRQIEHIENFMHKLPGYVYNTDSILNLQVIDWLAGEINERKRLEMVVRRMRGSRQNLKVLAAINSENWQYRDLISQIFLNNYEGQAWRDFGTVMEPDVKAVLRKVWLRNVTKIGDIQKEWLSENYGFVSGNIDFIGFEKTLALLEGVVVKQLDDEHPGLTEKIICNNAYEINANNLTVIFNHYHATDAPKDHLNYAMIKSIPNEQFQAYVHADINQTVKSLSKHGANEPANMMLELTNNDSLEVNTWYEYIALQSDKIADTALVKDDRRFTALYKADRVIPVWKNVFAYIERLEVDDTLIKYIERNIEDVEKTEFDFGVNNRKAVFRALVLTNTLPMELYKRVAAHIPEKIEDADIQYMDELKNDRIDYLLNHGLFTYSDDMRGWMLQNPCYADYIMKFRRQMMRNYEHIVYTAELALRIMIQRGFSDDERMKFIPLFPAEEYGKSTELAGCVCELLTRYELNLDLDQVLAIIQNTRNEKIRVMYAAYTIEKNLADAAIVHDILKALGGKYNEMNTTLNPLFDKTEYNEYLIDLLERGGYLSSTDKVKTPGKIRVYTRKG